MRVKKRDYFVIFDENIFFLSRIKEAIYTKGKARC